MSTAATLVGTVLAANDHGVLVDAHDGWLNYSKSLPQPLPEPARINGQRVALTLVPWKDTQLVTALAIDDQREPTSSSATPPGPQPHLGQRTQAQPQPEPAATEAPTKTSGISDRDLMMARMSSLKAAVHLGAASGASSEAVLQVADRFLSYILAHD